MKKYLVLILFTLCTTMSFGQSNSQDVVYLKNGTIIRGVIIELIPNKSIKIETADRSVFVYQMDEIEKVIKRSIQEEVIKRSIQEGKIGGSLSNSSLPSDYMVYKGIVELGYQIGVGEFGLNRLKLNIINGVQINPFFSLGFGTGLRYYLDSHFKSKPETLLIPVFADFRAQAMNNKVSPFLAIAVGYSFNASNDFEGVGLLLNPSIGVSFKVSDKSAMNISIGYEIQKITYQLLTFSSTINESAIGINVGISF